MKNCFPLLLLVSVLIAACDKKDPLPPVQNPPKWVNPLDGLPDEGRIRWDGLKVGQRSRYLYFEASGTGAPADIAPSYFQDTLVLAITGEDAQGFVLKEFIIPDSAGRFVSDTITLLGNHLKIRQDTLLFIPDKLYNSLIFTQGSRTLPLTPFAPPAPEYPEACPYFGYSTDRWTSFTQQHTHLGHTYGPLNMVFDYADMSSDGWGYLYAYNASDGLVRFTWVSYGSLNLAKGWDLLEE